MEKKPKKQYWDGNNAKKHRVIENHDKKQKYSRKISVKFDKIGRGRAAD